MRTKTIKKALSDDTLANDFFCCELIFIGHKFQNIDHFLSQRRFYRLFKDVINLIGKNNLMIFAIFTDIRHNSYSKYLIFNRFYNYSIITY